MEFIQPKNKNGTPTTWNISEHTRAIVEYYAQYTEYDESEIADEFLKNILKDRGFIAWITKKRNNKRMMSRLYPDNPVRK